MFPLNNADLCTLHLPYQQDPPEKIGLGSSHNAAYVRALQPSQCTFFFFLLPNSNINTIMSESTYSLQVRRKIFDVIPGMNVRNERPYHNDQLALHSHRRCPSFLVCLSRIATTTKRLRNQVARNARPARTRSRKGI